MIISTFLFDFFLKMALKINKQTWLKLQMNSKNDQQPNTNNNNNNNSTKTAPNNFNSNVNQIGNAAF